MRLYSRHRGVVRCCNHSYTIIIIIIDIIIIINILSLFSPGASSNSFLVAKPAV